MEKLRARDTDISECCYPVRSSCWTNVAKSERGSTPDMSVFTARALMIMMIVIIIINNLILTSCNVVFHRGKQSRKKHQPIPIYETRVLTKARVI
jgi:hypothetical protein